jgi:uncharacterized phiE125 gp8 family phage protein
MPWTETAAPSALAINLEDLKSHLRVTSNDEDGLLSIYAKAAAQLFETNTRRRLISRTFRWEQPDFPTDCHGIELPFAPVSAVSSVQYYDTAGTLTTWGASNYYLDTVSLPPRVTLRPNKTYPTVQHDRPNGVQVNFTAGYGANYQSVPEGIQWAVMLLAGHMWTTRAPVASTTMSDVPKTLGYAIDAYKIWGA